jgi:hypothetical protein
MTNGTKAAYTFLAAVRRGAAGEIKVTDTLDSSIKARAEIAVSVPIKSHATVPKVQALLYGPGDVTGIDRRQVLSVDPPDLTPDFEPNYFPTIEFDLPYFPWLFTPATANAKGQLRPWICLVAVEESKVKLEWTPNKPLPVLTVPNAAQELPDLADSFAWAHAQVSGPLSDVGDVLANRPERNLSRLLCPRRLKSDTTYYACVVPTFEAGRKAGLGEDITQADLNNLQPAWHVKSPPGVSTNHPIPVYYHWKFTTGAAGDFESLVSLLKPRLMPPEVGTRRMDIGDAGGGLPQATAGAKRIVGFEGALQPPDFTPATWPDGTTGFQANLATTLEASLNAPESRTDSDPVALLGPPIYGRWQSARRTVPKATESPPWVRELNLDPRNRAAAGLGSLVVQDQQEQLMAAAWEQVAELERVNEVLRRAQLARLASSSLHAHLAAMPAGSVVQLTAPVHSRLLKKGTEATVVAHVRSTSLPDAALSSAFRRVLRPRGRLARRMLQGQPNWNDRTGPSLLERLNLRQVDAAPPRRDPKGIVTIDGVSKTAPIPSTARDVLRFHRLTKDAVMNVAPPGGNPELPNPAAFQLAAAAHQNALGAGVPIASKEPPPQANLTQLRTELVGALNPGVTIPAGLLPRLSLPTTWQTDDSLEPVMAAPQFPTAMYTPLRDMSQDLLLPGLEHVPPNTISLLETNTRFIEAYMVGLNHEMSRELLWREFPTDQRGTYFRQFWDVRGHLPPPPLDQLKDIEEIHTWSPTKELGDGSGGPQGRLVLLIRGEVLRRYPSATIYAVEAEWTNGTSKPRFPSKDATKQKLPIFQGSLAPDVTYLGFDLTEAQARGSTEPGTSTPRKHPGWYFVLQQQPTQPRFGLDEAPFTPGKPLTADQPPKESWSAMSWGHLTETEAAYNIMVNAPVLGSRPDKDKWAFTPPQVKWGADATAAHIAYIALQRPVRVQIHADDMLPKKVP